MELRDIFTREIICDHELLAALHYCVSEVQPTETTLKVNDDFIELRPYEVLICQHNVEHDLKMEWSRFKDKITIASRLKRWKLTVEANYIRLATTVKFPLNPVEEQRQPGSDIIPIPFQKWKEIDTRFVEENLSKNYLETTAFVLNDFEKIVGKMELQSINIYHYEEYVRNLSKRTNRAGNSISRVSINNYTRALKGSFGRAVDRQYLEKSPFAKIKPLREIKKQPIIFERQELKLILENIEPVWMRQVLLFACLTAERREEVVSTKWCDIDKERNIIPIRCSEGFAPKGGRERTLPLTDGVRELLDNVEKWQRENEIESDYVFTDDQGRKLTGDRVSKILKEAIRGFELREELNFHALRRTAASTLQFKDVSMAVIQKVLGHAAPKTTLKYLNVPEEEMINGLNQLVVSDFI